MISTCSKLILFSMFVVSFLAIQQLKNDTRYQSLHVTISLFALKIQHLNSQNTPHFNWIVQIVWAEN